MRRAQVLARLAPFAALAALAAAAAEVTACKPSPDQGTIEILTVDDPFTVDGGPPATMVTVQSVAYDDGGSNGAVTTLARGSVSQGTLDLGTYEETDTESLLVTATDQTGALVARGETLPIEVGAVAGLTLGVFVQRTGTLSRLPSPLSEQRPSPIVGILGGRYILVVGGSDIDAGLQAQTDLYDLIAWSPLAAPPSLPIVPQSIAIAQLQALAISATGAAWYDLTASVTDDAGVPPTGDNWADVAGGATVVATDSSASYVVGGTRTTGAATSAVLVVSSSGALSWLRLATPRLGATATYVDGLGLVVEGGNVAGADAGSAASGIEIISPGSTTPSPVAYPLDPVTGAGMTALDGSHVLVAGGTNGDAGTTGLRVFTVPCDATSCSTTTWASTLSTPLVFTQAFGIDASTAFVVGEDASGKMHAYRVTEAQVVEVAFRVPRSHARAIRLPIGTPDSGLIAVVGGDTTIETFTP